MLLKEVLYDDKAGYWMNDRKCNLLFIVTKEQYFNDLLRHRGYIYLNEICDGLGVGWNPMNENTCIKYDGICSIKFWCLERPNNSYLIQIIKD